MIEEALLILLLLPAAYFILRILGGWISPRAPRDLHLDFGQRLNWTRRGKRRPDLSPEVIGIVEEWAGIKLPSWKRYGKIKAPRIILARLMVGMGIEEANRYLQRQAPWGRSGSRWPGNPRGDYDFTETVLTTILFLFGEDEGVLYRRTKEHLLNVLLTDEGKGPRLHVQRTLWTFWETENHLLMTEGSRYLKNRWMAQHGDRSERYDNEKNGMEEWLIGFLRSLGQNGFYEYNSVPYSGYSITALLNLEAFGSEPIRKEARAVLDLTCLRYMIGSLSFRRLPPFRRQLRKLKSKSLTMDPLTCCMRTWAAISGREVALGRNGSQHMLLAVALPYMPPEEALGNAFEGKRGYLARIGHGPGSSPEIYSGGPGYLISAGGVNRGLLSRTVTRPTILLLDDGAEELRDVLHLRGPSGTVVHWNNTGVHKRFAVGKGGIHVPESFTKIDEREGWSLYRHRSGITVAVLSKSDFGAFYVLEGKKRKERFKELTLKNSGMGDPKGEFFRPEGGSMKFDVRAPRGKWVIIEVDGEKVDRNLDGWSGLNIDQG